MKANKNRQLAYNRISTERGLQKKLILTFLKKIESNYAEALFNISKADLKNYTLFNQCSNLSLYLEAAKEL